MPLLLGIDIETTGLEIGKDSVTEIGWAVWDTEKRALCSLHSHFVTLPPGVVYSKELAVLTGFDADILDRYGKPLSTVLSLLGVEQFDYFCAHNGLRFDKPFLQAVCESGGMAKMFFDTRPWIDTKIDLPLTYKPKSTALVYMAADHGFLNPFPHRALFDCLTMFKVLSQYDIDKVIQSAMSPMVRLVAKVSYDGRQLAKDAGFFWDAEKKTWFIECRGIKSAEIIERCPFPVTSTAI